MLHQQFRSLFSSLFNAKSLSTINAGGTKKLTTLDFIQRKHQNKRFAVMTAYDYPSARHCDQTDIDMLLVGDSLGMVILGYSTTLPVTMEDCLYHCRAVRRGAPRRFIVGDMPFGSYETGEKDALHNAFRFVKEGSVDAVKLEGGRSRAHIVKAFVGAGIPVCGHVGLTPQGVNVIGGFRAQGRTADKAMGIIEDALALQAAGAFAVVIECVPSVVAKAITEALHIPTIGIGAGGHTTAQVLVYHDMLGINYSTEDPKSAPPAFCKMYAELGPSIRAALRSYRQEVLNGSFPAAANDTYSMSEQEQTKFLALLGGLQGHDAATAPLEAPSDVTKVY